MCSFIQQVHTVFKPTMRQRVSHCFWCRIFCKKIILLCFVIIVKVCVSKCNIGGCIEHGQRTTIVFMYDRSFGLFNWHIVRPVHTWVPALLHY